MDMITINKKQKIYFSLLIAMLYLICLYLTRSHSFGIYQVRIATSLYSLSYLFPFLVLPLGLANLLGNLLCNDLGYWDLIGGLITGLLTCYSHTKISKAGLSDWLMLFTITFIPGLIVPIWLSKIILIPYQRLAIALCTGQILSALLGVLLVKTLKSMIYGSIEGENLNDR